MTLKTYLTLGIMVFASLFNQVAAQNPDEIIVRKKGLGFAYYHNNRELSQQELLYMLDTVPEAQTELKRGHRNILPAKVLSYAGSLLLVYPMGAHFAGANANWAVTGIGAGLMFLSLPFTGAVMKREQQAIGVYNGNVQYASKPRVDMRFGYESHGATLKLTF